MQADGRPVGSKDTLKEVKRFTFGNDMKGITRMWQLQIKEIIVGMTQLG